MDAVRHSLKNIFGFDDFRRGQEKVVSQLIQGNSALAIFPTGSGKSLCYQLPALHLPGLTVVISPLIALMKDQIDFLLSKGVAAARLDSTLSLDEYRQVWNQVESGELKLLYIAPERLSNEKFSQKLKRFSISMMVIDEAHCISEWGHNFRPDYLKLTAVAQDLKVERVLALTATATPQVAADIRRNFAIADEAYVNIGYYRPNLEIRLSPIPRDEKKHALLKKIQERASGATIVYVTLQKTAVEVADFLVENGLPAMPYHAGFKAEERTRIQDEFMGSPQAIVVATIAFGMGIDKADIRYVYHYNLPQSLENYSQEIGRAGRDGKPSLCEVLANDTDRIVLENFTYGDTPGRESIDSLVEEVFSLGDTFDISIYHLSARHDMRQLVISTLLCYLELEGLIQSTGPFYSQYKYQFLVPLENIMQRFNSERQTFLNSVFNTAHKGRLWMTVDIDKCVNEIGTDRKRVTSALNYLEDQGLLKTQVSGVRLGYKLLQQGVNTHEVCEALYKRFINSETRNISRIRQLGSFITSENCTVRALLSYFGEDLGRDCGHCDRCTGDFNNSLQAELREDLTTEEQRTITNALSLKHAALQRPRQLAKFLCGITSPAASRSRPSLSKHELFASLSQVPFQLVLQSSQEQLQKNQ